jgi:hypothetical protein
MANNNGYQSSILWDDVHVLTVSHQREEIYISENVGGAPGELRIKAPEVTIRADLRDPLRVLEMAIRYVIRYDLLARVLDAEVVRVFEQMGVKGFLDQLLGLTTEQLRRERFNGFEFFEFTINPKPKDSPLRDEPDDDEPEDEEEAESPEPTSVAAAIKAPRRRRSSSS